MSNPTRSLFALDPQTQKVRLVLQVTPDGWEGTELETVLAGVIPVLGNAGIKVALLISQETSFLLRKDDNENHFDIDEVQTTEVVAPLALESEPSKLFETVESWVQQVASSWQEFVPQTKLPKRIPEIVPLIAGAKIRARDGAIGVPEDLVAMPVERLNG